MKTKAMRMSLITVTVIALAGMAVVAVADPGYGRYHMGWGNTAGGPADCPRWGGNGAGDGDAERRGYGAGSGMDDAQAKQFQEKQEAFYAGTADLRQEIYQKRLEMKAEFAKKSPDSKKLSALQKEISGLEATFDQKRLEHRIDMQKSFPDVASGYGRGYGRGMMGQGGGYGRGMMGQGGGYGPGNCGR
ncbi:MAG: periplasmic heavy metal sensor [Pseudomonadota bacterium]